MTSAAREQPGRGVGPSRGRGQRAQSQNTRHDLSNIVIGWREAFGMQLAERDMQGPLIGTGSHFGSRQAPRLDLAEGRPLHILQPIRTVCTKPAIGRRLRIVLPSDAYG